MTRITRQPRKARYANHMTKAIILLAALACSACATHTLDTDDPSCIVDAGAPTVDAGPLPTLWRCTCTLPTSIAPTAESIAALRAPCSVDDPVGELAPLICQGAVPCACSCEPWVEPGESLPRSCE